METTDCRYLLGWGLQVSAKTRRPNSEAEYMGLRKGYTGIMRISGGV